MRPEIILGCPGCGKTTALLDEVDAELTRGVPPDRIAYLSFTRRAAEEAVTRACAKWGLAREQLPHFRTLHSLAFRALGLSSTDVLEGPKLREFADWAGIRITGKGWDPEVGAFVGVTPGDRALHMENLARVRCCPLRQLYDADDDGLPWDEVERVAGALAAHKRGRHLLDFTDMLSELMRLGTPPDLDVMVVDEAQDLSALMWRTVHWLASRCRRLIVAGDDDQAIYQWAGADVDQFVDMRGDARVLSQSYRVPGAVQALAAEVIGGVAHRRPKAWAARAEPGAVAVAVGIEDVDLTPAASGPWEGGVQPVLVLARNTYVLRDQVAPALREAGVLYEWRDEQPVDPAVQRAVVAWEALRAGKRVAAAVVRGIFNLMTPGRGVLRKHRDLAGVPDDYELGLDELARDHGLLTRAVWREALDRVGDDDAAVVVAAVKCGERLGQRPRVRLSTIHGAKGGEARHVVLMREMARRSYREMERSPDEERRTWYVGVTRAREKLTVVEGKRKEVCPWV